MSRCNESTGAKITYNLTVCHMTAFKFYSGVLKFSSSGQLCNLILLFLSQRHVTRNPCFLTKDVLVFRGINERKLNI